MQMKTKILKYKWSLNICHKTMFNLHCKVHFCQFALLCQSLSRWMHPMLWSTFSSAQICAFQRLSIIAHEILFPIMQYSALVLQASRWRTVNSWLAHIKGGEYLLAMSACLRVYCLPCATCELILCEAFSSLEVFSFQAEFIIFNFHACSCNASKCEFVILSN